MRAHGASSNGRQGGRGRGGGGGRNTITPTLITAASTPASTSESSSSSSAGTNGTASLSAPLPPVVAQVVGEAVRGNVAACVQLIRDSLSPAEADARLDGMGTTLLRKACEYGSTEVVRALLEKGARVSEEKPSTSSSSGDSDGKKSKEAPRPSCLEIAYSKGNEELLQLLVPHADAADRQACLHAALLAASDTYTCAENNKDTSGGSGSSGTDSNSNSTSTIGTSSSASTNGGVDATASNSKGPGESDDARLARLAALLLQGGSETEAPTTTPSQQQQHPEHPPSGAQLFSSSQSSLLHEAVNRGLNGVVELLLAHGFAEDLLSFDGDGLSPLQLAEKRYVQALIRHTVQVKQGSRHNRSRRMLGHLDLHPNEEAAMMDFAHFLHHRDHDHNSGSEDDSDEFGSDDEEFPSIHEDDEEDDDDEGDEEEEEEEEYSEEEDEDEEDEERQAAGDSRGQGGAWGNVSMDASSTMFLRTLDTDLKRTRGDVVLKDAVAVFERTLVLLYNAMGIKSALFSEFGFLQIEGKLHIVADYGVPKLLDELAAQFNMAPWPAAVAASASGVQVAAEIPKPGESKAHDASKGNKIDIDAIVKDASKSRNHRLTQSDAVADPTHAPSEAENAFVELGFVNNNAASRDFMDALNLIAELRRSVDNAASLDHIKQRRARLYCEAMRLPPGTLRGAEARDFALAHPESVQLLTERAVRSIIWCLSSPCEDLDTAAILEWAFILQSYTDIYTPVHCLPKDMLTYYNRTGAQKEGSKTKNARRGRKGKKQASGSASGDGDAIGVAIYDTSKDVAEINSAVTSNPLDFYTCRLVLDADCDPLRGLCHPAVAAQMLDNIGELGYMILLGITGQDWTGTSDSDPNVLMDRDIDLFYNYLELINRVLIPRIFAIHQSSCADNYTAARKADTAYAAPSSRITVPFKRAATKVDNLAPAEANWGVKGGSLLGDVAKTLFGDIVPLFWNLEMALSLLSGHVIEDQLLRLQAMIKGVYVWEMWEVTTAHEGVTRRKQKQAALKPFTNVMPRSNKQWKQSQLGELFVPESWRFQVDMLSFNPRTRDREFHDASWRVETVRSLPTSIGSSTVAAGAVANDASLPSGLDVNSNPAQSNSRNRGRQNRRNKKKSAELFSAHDSINHMLSVPNNFRIKIPRPQSIVDLLERRSHAIRWLLYSNDGPILEGLEFLERFPWVLSGDQMIEYVNDKLDELGGDSEDEDGRIDIVLNRFAEPAVWVESLLQQTQVNQKDLYRKFLKIRFDDEPGTGPGPLKEFFELCRILFQISPLSTTSLMDSVAGTASSGKSQKGKKRSKADASASAGPVGAGPEASAESTVAGTAQSSLPAITELFPLFQPAGDCNPECVIPVSISAICDRLEKAKQWDDDSKKAALHSFVELMFESIGFLLAHSIRNEAPMGVLLPDIVWAMIAGETRFNWVDFCGSDKTLLRSCANLLYQDDVASLMMTFQASRTTWVQRTDALASESNVNDSLPPPAAGPALQRSASSSESGAGSSSGGGGPIMVAVPVDVDLIENGSEVEVTKDNVLRFVNLMTKLKCLNGSEDSIAAIRAGFSKVIPNKYLRMYFPGALSKVVQSVDTIDVPALRERVLYDFPYHPTHRVARMFWHLVEKELSVEDVRKLLLFWTGSSIVPREDVEENKLHISFLSGGSRPTQTGKPRLPEASTCHNHLYLPAYNTLDEMRHAIRAVVEFGCIGYDRL